MLCSEEFLEVELNTIKSIFHNDSYPDKLLSRTIISHIDSFRQIPTSTSQEDEEKKVPIYLQFPYIGAISESYRKKMITAGRCRYSLLSSCQSSHHSNL